MRLAWNVKGGTAAAGGETFQQWGFQFQPKTTIQLDAVKVSGYTALVADGGLIKTIPLKVQILSATGIAFSPEGATPLAGTPTFDDTQIEFISDVSEGATDLDTYVQAGTNCLIFVRTFPKAALAVGDVTGFYFQLWYERVKGEIFK